MADRYSTFAHSPAGRVLVKRLGLPDPPVLRRYHPGDPLVTAPVLIGGSGRLAGPARTGLAAAGVVLTDADVLAGLVFDATGPTTLRELYDFFHPRAKSLQACGRVIVLGTPGEDCRNPTEASGQQALEGFVRSVGKEFGRGITAQLILVAEHAESNMDSTLRFLLSARSAYVSGQVIRISPAGTHAPDDWDRPLAGKVALVTGAARGIGASIVDVLTRDGAQVLGIDLPLDITADDAPRAIADRVVTEHGGVDIVVHNAGITRDRTLARMTPQEWDAVLDVNLQAPQRINALLLGERLLRREGRIIGVSSIAGIAGNRGQTNYATSKAGVIGMVRSQARALQKWSITANAVAPGFIDTPMTAAMPIVLREAGRRMNSLAQAGQPVDVAETVAWLASPGSNGVTANVIRVCGQSLLGA
jgi:3-oxoacyl-[acyl-carrier protein] reductase